MIADIQQWFFWSLSYSLLTRIQPLRIDSSINWDDCYLVESGTSIYRSDRQQSLQRGQLFFGHEQQLGQR